MPAAATTNSAKTVNSTAPVRRVNGERRFHQADRPLASSAPVPDSSPVPVSGFSVVVLKACCAPQLECPRTWPILRRGCSSPRHPPPYGTPHLRLPRTDREGRTEVVPAAGA